MPIYDLDNGPLFVYYNQRTIDQVDYLLSRRLERHFFGQNEPERNVEAALFFSFDWCAKKMLEILRAQKQVCFFQCLFILHEMSCPYTEMQPGKSPVPAIGNWDFGVYRRVLKLCLEQGCDLMLTDTEHFSLSYLEIIEPVLSELIYLGSLAFEFSACLAEEKLSRDSFHFSFEHGIWRFQRTSASELRAFQLMSYVKNYKTDAYDRQGPENFIQAVKDCFGFEFKKITELIVFVHGHFEDSGGRLVLIKWNAYPALLERLFQIPLERGVAFLKGLTLSRRNKLSLQESIYRTDSLNRYLYRPILVLEVNGEEMALVGENAFDQSIVSLCMQGFGWRKFPIEWENGCFERWVDAVASKNDKILEDAVVALLGRHRLLYDRNVRMLLKPDNRNRAIVPEPGEIDLLFVYKDILYVAECKHQLVRYDMSNFVHDVANFRKTYNKKLSKKIKFIRDNLPALKGHFQVKENNFPLSLDFVRVEGLFIVNTPTFLLFENEFPVFGYPQLEGYFSAGVPLEKMIEIDLGLF